jgi:hypothetical protein
VPRERDVERRAVERRGFFAAPLERGDDDLLALAPDDFARLAAGFFAAVLLRAVLLRAVDFRALLFRAVLLRAVDLRAPLLRDEEEEPPELALASPSIDHLPVITRCAASATASAISEPSLVALAATLAAACDAVSAASKPASRIARRAFGLALIAAAAAARPAASISLLIAAFLILSVMSLVLEEDFEEDRDDDDLDDDDFDEDDLLGDLAMAALLRREKRHSTAVTVPE